MSADKLDFLLRLQEDLGGAIPFDRWMAEALYHPHFGYYAASVRSIGRGGDFTTWPVRHRSLAEALARWACTHRPAGRWHLIEIGAGTGALADAVLRAIGWWNRPRLHLVEISAPLRAAQQKLLGRRAQWHGSVAEALEAAGGEAVIYSNELVDAFPARIFARRGGGWRELCLRLAGGAIHEEWRDVPLPSSTVFDHPWPEGQRVEVQESHRRWLAEWLPHWRRGVMATIDYGAACPALYHRRPGGTLRAYAHHQRLEGREAYGGFGVRDLTVDVNFSDLLAPATPGTVFPLSHFLTAHRVPVPPGFEGAAEAFQVLLQEAPRVAGAS